MRTIPRTSLTCDTLIYGLLVAFTAACDNPSSRTTPIVADSAGIRVVTSFVPQWAAGDAWSIEQTPLLEIGAVESARDEKLFQDVVGVTRLAGGEVIVLEGSASELRWFDGDGEPLRVAGGRGRGPGELTGPTQLLRLADDTLIVLDSRARKLVAYSRQGALLYEQEVSVPFTELCPLQVIPNLSVLHCARDESIQSGASSTGAGMRTLSRVIVTAADGTETPLGIWGELEQWRVGENYVFHPFSSLSVAAAGGTPTFVGIVFNPEYSIELWTPEGALATIIRRSPARRTATVTEREVARAELEQFSFGVPIDQIITATADVEVVPALLRLRFDTAGYLFATRRPAALRPDSTFIDVFNEDGFYLGELAIPGYFEAHEIGHDYIAGVRRGEFDVPVVVVYGLVRD